MASVIHATAHGLVANDPFRFGNVVPTDSGVDETVTYYVLAAGLTADTFTFSTTPGGTAFVLTAAITEGVIREGDTYTVVDDGNMSPPDDPAAPTGLTLTSTVTIDADGHQIVEVKAAFTPATTPGILGVKVELAVTAGLDWTTAKVLRAPLGTNFVRFQVPGNVGYSVRAASEGVYGAVSVYTAVVTHTATKDSSAPATPSGFSMSDYILGVTADWTANTEADLSHYELLIDDDPAFGSPFTFRVKANTLPVNPLTGGVWYGKVRAVDTSGNASAYCASDNATARLVETGDIDPSAVIENATNLINGPATVTIDDTGLTVEDGAFILKDPFGTTVMVASGFSGSWNDFVANGLYNARLISGTVGVVPLGRTAALPYWTVSDPDTTVTTLTFLSGGGAKMTWGQISKRKRIVSDPVPVAGRYFEVGGEFIAHIAAGNITQVITVLWYDSTGAALSSTVVSTIAPPFSDVRYFTSDSVETPSTARFAAIQIDAMEITSHSAANFLTVYGAFIKWTPGQLNNILVDGLDVAGGAAIGTTLTVAGATVSVVGHGAADHTDITRSLFLYPTGAALDSATLVAKGASPDLYSVIAYADAATQGAYWTVLIPADWASGTISVQPIWVPGSTDASAHTVRWSAIIRRISDSVNANSAGTTVTWTGASAARTANVTVADTLTDTAINSTGANEVFRINLRRIGADGADTYVGVVNLLALRLTYTANQ